MERIFVNTHSAIEVHFSKNSSDFVVKENPLYEFSGDGEHLVLLIRKKDLTTWQMLEELAKQAGIRVQEFGYAGLKDKDGMTTQYISILKKYEDKFTNFNHDKIKILSKTYHKNKIKIGHLKSNTFFIRLKKVSQIDAKKLENALEKLKNEGFANYFGYQRFGREANNFQEGLQILRGEKKIKNKKVRKFLISAYQSHLFNDYLSKRIQMSKFFNDFSIKELEKIYSFPLDLIKEIKNQKHFFKLLPGDICHHFPYGRAYELKDLSSESDRFIKREIVPTAPIIGSKSLRSSGVSKEFEDEIFIEAEKYIQKMEGSVRFAWSFADDVSYEYKEDKAQFEMSFSLQKGSYATVVLEELLCRKLK